ncbi:hypothetical protein [Paenibacillus sp. Z6-24]
MRLPQYYLLQNDERIERRIQPFSPLANGKDFAAMPPVQVWNTVAPKDAEYTDYLSIGNTVLFSDPLKHILSKYNLKSSFKLIYLMSQNTGESHSYWVCNMLGIHALSVKAEFYPHNQALKRLVLDASQAEGHHFFKLEGIREPHIFLSMDAAESLLRRHLTGYVLQPVDMSIGG